eukprot:CAMPEP_0181066890 /NCGR_PEP_ID=MMETSP1070-20121207/25577_1 /TAXON_ID=265543 /ORGANISM="Minutocellus polymorphus, Strain NH13" /LENGTH=402 /DNA_ID=CAMNT_0023147505 /DNA_START=36 /DNA_END=1244 /DNA_ORIENTATION=+
MMGCGNADPMNCPANANEEFVVVEKDCSSYSDCLGCLGDPACGSWYPGIGCYGSCMISDTSCYKSAAGQTPGQVCARADTDEADNAICSNAKLDSCASCTATPLSVGNDNCAWFGDYCGRPGCTMMGCGNADPMNCPANANEEFVVVEKDCSSYSDCLGCLGDPACGSWYPGIGCYGSCMISDTSCYKSAAGQTPGQVCARADTDEADNAICSNAKLDSCASCTATPLSVGNDNCAWFGDYCGRPGCIMMGMNCGNADPMKCPAVEPPAEDGFKLISLSEDDSLCVGIAGGKPMPKKILKLAKCDENNTNLMWKMDGRGRIMTKEKYNGVSLCWHPKVIINGSSIKLKNCKRSRKQRFSYSGTGPLRSRDPNLCISPATDSPTTGVKVKLQDCSGGSSQDWS